jgi:RHS repeat-associated protein
MDLVFLGFDINRTDFVFYLRYPGQQYDSATGFNHNYFRDYDTIGGRYVQSDPIGLAGGISTYAYAGGNPLTRFDPYGLLQWSLNPTEWRHDTETGDITRTYPGARASQFRSNTLARTTIDWDINVSCECVSGSFQANEFTVSITPIVLMRSRYASFDIQRDTRRDEMDHVRDLTSWANGEKPNAEVFESQFKIKSFVSQQECIDKARAAMQYYLARSIAPAVEASRQRWDVSGRHRLIVPGD